MSWQTLDRVAETSTTTGTGAYTLGGAKTGYRAFSAVGDGNTCYYVATDGTDWEVGVGTYTLSGTTLARTSILASSNSNAAVSWGAGTRDVFLDAPAAKLIQMDSSGKVGIGLTATQALDVSGSIRSTVGFNIGGAEVLGTNTATGTNTFVTLNDVSGTAVLQIGTATTSGGRAYGLGFQPGTAVANYNLFNIGPDFNILADAVAKTNASAQHSQGARFDGTNWTYIENGDLASSYGLNNGKIFFRTAGTATSTAAGATITWQERLLLHNNGFIAIGGTGAPSFTPAFQVDVRGDVNIRGTGADSYRIAAQKALSQAVVGTSTYTTFYTPNGTQALLLGDTAAGDPTFYYEGNSHQFYNFGGSVIYTTIDGTGIKIPTGGLLKMDNVTTLFHATGKTTLTAGGSPSPKINLTDGADIQMVGAMTFADLSGNPYGSWDSSNFLVVGDGSTFQTIINASGVTNEPTAGGPTADVGFVLVPSDAHGAGLTQGYSHELFVPNTAALTGDTVTSMLPAGSIIVGVTWRVTTAFSGSGTLSIGDAATAARFASGVAITAGTTGSSFATMNSANTNPQGPVQASAAKIRLTRSTGTFNGTGAIRLVVFYQRLIAPAS